VVMSKLLPNVACLLYKYILYWYLSTRGVVIGDVVIIVITIFLGVSS